MFDALNLKGNGVEKHVGQKFDKLTTKFGFGLVESDIGGWHKEDEILEEDNQFQFGDFFVYTEIEGFTEGYFSKQSFKSTKNNTELDFVIGYTQNGSQSPGIIIQV